MYHQVMLYPCFLDWHFGWLEGLSGWLEGLSGRLLLRCVAFYPLSFLYFTDQVKCPVCYPKQKDILPEKVVGYQNVSSVQASLFEYLAGKGEKTKDKRTITYSRENFSMVISRSFLMWGKPQGTVTAVEILSSFKIDK